MSMIMKGWERLTNTLQKLHVFWRLLLLIPLIVSGYIMGITIIQLGLPSLGTETLLLDPAVVSGGMMSLAFAGGGGALAGGKLLNKIQDRFYAICGIILASMIASTLIFSGIPMLTNAIDYVLFLVILGLVLGVSSPFIFGTVYYLVPAGRRGLMGGVMSALIYGVGTATLPSDWNLSSLTGELTFSTLLSGISIIMLIFFIIGRPVSRTIIAECRGEKAVRPYSFKFVLVVLTLILFIDSFGFMRVINTPFVALTWQGPLTTKIAIGIVQAIAAILFGILYDRSSPTSVIKWALILFLVADVIFVVFYGLGNWEGFLMVVFPLLYGAAVAIYTTLFLVLWADLATSQNVGKVFGRSQALTTWIASFLSTGIALALIDLISVQIHIALAAGLSLITLILTWKKLRN